LADPRSAEARDRVNARIKFREAFRPFAPAVLSEHADDWFEIPAPLRCSTHHMMATVPVRQQCREKIPATTHVDGSARVQLVDAERQPIFHQLLSSVYERTGVPIVLNTSFNLRGEPIVSSPIDAAATLLRSELDALYIEGFRVTRHA
jgi:carbamoyltransferase